MLELLTIPRGPARERWVPLLELADEPIPIRGYLHQGTLHAIEDEHGEPRAAVLEIELSKDGAELRTVAVAELQQGRGIGSWIVTEVCGRLHMAGKRRVVVGTASSGLRQLGFYQRLGFRLSHVERDYFTPQRGYPAGDFENGIRVRDMVWMDKSL